MRFKPLHEAKGAPVSIWSDGVCRMVYRMGFENWTKLDAFMDWPNLEFFELWNETRKNPKGRLVNFI